MLVCTPAPYLGDRRARGTGSQPSAEPGRLSRTPPALQGRLRFWIQDRTADIYPASRGVRRRGPLMTFARRGLNQGDGVRATVATIRLILRRSDLFPSATTLWQSWRVV